jgi:dTDP-4-amino-4,6-dideoxygalactose transaminase
MKIPFTRIPLCKNEFKYVKEVLNSGWLTSATKTLAFEEKFADYVGARYACAVNSCTASLHLGLEALGLKPGQRVFVPSMTFTASAEIIRYLQGDPVFLDIEYGTNLVSPEILRNAIIKYPDVKFLVVVHFGGQAAQMISKDSEGLLEICRKNGIKILEDAAHAFPSRLFNNYVGSFGDVTCFSFYANKTITSGEGGMLVTNDSDIYKHVKIMRLHGIDRDVWDRYTSDKPSWEYDIVAAGFKYNMPDINAAVGLAQLEQAELFRSERQKVAEYYMENLNNKYLDLPLLHVPMEDHSWHLYSIVLKDNAPINRNTFIEKLNESGIGTSVHYKPLHRMTYYKNKYNLIPDDYPNSELTWKGNVSLPIYPFMSIKELEYICYTCNNLFE